ncbi:MAG: DUF5694 domain-containing protein [Bacteroidota bacterium]
MNKISVILLSLLLLGCQEKQETSEVLDLNNAEENQLKTPGSFFPSEKTKVLVVGTFHFNYPGLDDHKVTPENQIDVLKEPKKSEVTELVNYIKKFKPTKIAIEANPGWKATEKLQKYKRGELRDKRDERYQLAMRLASEIQLDTLYEVNSYSLSRQLYKADSTYLKTITGNVDWDLEDPYWDHVESWFDYDDKLVSKTNLTDYFSHMNSRESHEYGYGIYLLGSFKTENNQGADHLSIWWYNRNLRIFRNIQGITQGPEDRILVVMGNGHAAILRQLFEASPEYEFVEFNSL